PLPDGRLIGRTGAARPGVAEFTVRPDGGPYNPSPPFRIERRMRGRLSIVLITLAWTAAAAAETAYVTDLLQLGLHQASDTSDRPFANLPSGTRLEVLERKTHYARVRTDGGDEGWVKAAYIV